MSKVPFDPQILPVDSLGGEAPIGSERLTASWLRTRFAEPPDWLPEMSEEHAARVAMGDQLAASVLMPIVLREQGPTLLFTQRTSHLTDHAGQVSFPGGRAEEYDESPIATALRETEEEVGLDRRHIEVIGTLPEYFIATGYRITPVVGIVHPPFELRADPHEVEEIFEVPLTFLMNGMNHQRRIAVFPNGTGRRSFYAMPYERFFIWGATAGMLRNLFHFLRA